MESRWSHSHELASYAGVVALLALLAWMEQLRAAAPALQMLFLDVSEEFARVHFEHSSAELSSLRRGAAGSSCL